MDGRIMNQNSPPLPDLAAWHRVTYWTWKAQGLLTVYQVHEVPDLGWLAVAMDIDGAHQLGDAASPEEAYKLCAQDAAQRQQELDFLADS